MVGFLENNIVFGRIVSRKHFKNLRPLKKSGLTFSLKIFDGDAHANQ